MWQSWFLNCNTCSGWRNTIFPKTMTFPAWSSILANSTPCSSFPHSSTQIWINSEYEIELFGISLSLAFSFSTWATLKSFFTSWTETPNCSGSPATGPVAGGGASPSRWSRSSVMLMPLSFSLSLSPTGRDRNSDNWFMDFRWKNRRKKLFSADFDEGRCSLWKLVLGAFGGSKGEEQIGECSMVTAGEGNV